MANANLKPQPSCQDGGDSSELSVSDARQTILRNIQPLDCRQRLPIRTALNRVLAEDIISPIDVPSHANSAMDGYAIAGNDSATDTPVELSLVGTAWAGKPFTEKVQASQAVRIMTGAILPTGTDTVIIQEHVERSNNRIRFKGDYRRGQNVRLAGEDLARGQTVLAAGKYLLPPDLGLLASLGIAEVSVTRPLRVAFFSSGDELRCIGDTLEPGQIYDSNRYTLYGMLKRLAVDIIDMGVVPDDPDAIRQALLSASKHADAVITSGGVSVGEADYIKAILQQLGTVSFWKIAMKPGRPLAYGKINDTPFFGLPGNPVAVMVTFYQFVQPALQRIMGQQTTEPLCFQARSESTIRKRPGRMEYQRGILTSNGNGELTVSTTGRQGSGILRSMSTANCFIILDEHSDTIEPGELVQVQPFACIM